MKPRSSPGSERESANVFGENRLVTFTSAFNILPPVVHFQLSIAMSAFERFWTSYPAKIMVRAIARLFPTWFHEVTWQWGEQEGIIRRELLEKSKDCANAAMLKNMVLRTHALFLTVLNEQHGGSALERYIPQMTVRSFSEIYTIVMALFCFRASRSTDHIREDLTAICRESHLVERVWKILEKQEDDANLQARCVWHECLQVFAGDKASETSFFGGFFVILVNRASDELGVMPASTPCDTPPR